MTRLADAWRSMQPEQRLAAVSALALLATMFLPWYGLQSLDRRSGVINSHAISAFGDVSFVEAAIFLVAAAVIAMLLARADGREFHLPGGDGTIVMLAGGWAALLIFYRVFSRPAGGGEPVGIEWGFFLAFVAAGSLAYAGWRMRAREHPEAPLRRPRAGRPYTGDAPDDVDPTVAIGSRPRRRPPAEPVSGGEPHQPREEEAGQQAGAEGAPAREAARAGGQSRPSRPRSRYPPAPSEPEQLSFEDPPTRPR